MNWRRPDWQIDSNYPKSATTSIKQWGWEFLRRNQDYEMDFSRAKLEGEHSDKDALSKKWNMFELIDPARDYGNELDDAVIVHSTPDVADRAVLEFLGPLSEIVRPSEVAVIVDLSLPIEDQLDAAKKVVLIYQENFLVENEDVRLWDKNIPSNAFPAYLRILDAKAVKPTITSAEIANVLFPAEDLDSAAKKVRDNTTQAKKWSSFGYKKLFLKSAAN